MIDVESDSRLTPSPSGLLPGLRQFQHRSAHVIRLMQHHPPLKRRQAGGQPRILTLQFLRKILILADRNTKNGLEAG